MKINYVEKESIAASIGLKPGDRLESIDGSKAVSYTHLTLPTNREV